ncbi:MAG: hypothetical protein HY811_06615 [Planctomycetes bacterium]|nr:hypothetical protein [Planctomycetota bacterium]
MIIKPQIIIRILSAFFIAFLVYHSAVIYPQGAKPDSQAIIKPKLAVGQWVLYEISISKHSASEIRSYLFKINLAGEEQIEGESYFWEEVSLVSEGVSIISLKKNSYDKPRKVIFKRAGFQALEIEQADIERKLKINISNIIPEFITPFNGVNTDGNILASDEKVKYTVPANSKKIICREFTSSDKGKNRQVISLVSEDIPITGLAQSTCVGRGSIITIKLVNFGHKGAKSVIDSKVLKFGEINK